MEKKESPCEMCGVFGFVDYLIYCSECNVATQHSYCMTVIPTEDNVIWYCEECVPVSPVVAFGNESVSTYGQTSVETSEDGQDLVRTVIPSEDGQDMSGNGYNISFHSKASQSMSAPDDTADHDTILSGNVVTFDQDVFRNQCQKASDSEVNVSSPGADGTHCFSRSLPMPKSNLSFVEADIIKRNRRKVILDDDAIVCEDNFGQGSLLQSMSPLASEIRIAATDAVALAVSSSSITSKEKGEPVNSPSMGEEMIVPFYASVDRCKIRKRNYKCVIDDEPSEDNVVTEDRQASTFKGASNTMVTGDLVNKQMPPFSADPNTIVNKLDAGNGATFNSKRRRLILNNEFPEEDYPAEFADTTGDLDNDTSAKHGSSQPSEIILPDLSDHGLNHTRFGQCDLLNSEMPERLSDAHKDQFIPYNSSFVDNFKLACAMPVVNPIWRGRVNVSGDLDVPLVAHLSNQAGEKACTGARSLPPILYVDKKSKFQYWPDSFKRSPPTDENIALYFFPSSERSCLIYEKILNEMIKENLILMITLEYAELLILPSIELPPRNQRFQGNIYLWGVFKRRQAEDYNVVSKGNDDKQPLTFENSDKERTLVDSSDHMLQNYLLASPWTRHKSAEVECSANLLSADKQDANSVTITCPGLPQEQILESEVRELCERMESCRFWQLIASTRRSNLVTLCPKLPSLLVVCADPAKFVLDTLWVGFSSWNNNTDKINNCEWFCVLMLKSLASIWISKSTSSQKNARRLANSWKHARKDWFLRPTSTAPPYAHTFLVHVATFGIVMEEERELYRTLVMSLSHRNEIAAVAIQLGLTGETMVSMIDELMEKDEPLQALNFIGEAGLVDKFPVPCLIRTCMRGCVKLPRQAKIHQLSAIVECLRCFKLESKFSPASLLNQIKQLKEHLKHDEQQSEGLQEPCGPRKSSKKQMKDGHKLKYENEMQYTIQNSSKKRMEGGYKLKVEDKLKPSVVHHKNHAKHGSTCGPWNMSMKRMEGGQELRVEDKSQPSPHYKNCSEHDRDARGPWKSSMKRMKGDHKPKVEDESQPSFHHKNNTEYNGAPYRRRKNKFSKFRQHRDSKDKFWHSNNVGDRRCASATWPSWPSPRALSRKPVSPRFHR